MTVKVTRSGRVSNTTLILVITADTSKRGSEKNMAIIITYYIMTKYIKINSVLVVIGQVIA